MIHLSGQVICETDQDVETVRAHLPEHIRLSRAEPGCLSFEVRQTADPLIWTVEERFADRPAFDAHQTRTKASPWFAATGHIRRSYQIRES
jgi:quinol monooxygenase YgiN